jgi:hypothetical protein
MAMLVLVFCGDDERDDVVDKVRVMMVYLMVIGVGEPLKTHLPVSFG